MDSTASRACKHYSCDCMSAAAVAAVVATPHCLTTRWAARSRVACVVRCAFRVLAAGGSERAFSKSLLLCCSLVKVHHVIARCLLKPWDVFAGAQLVYELRPCARQRTGHLWLKLAARRAAQLAAQRAWIFRSRFGRLLARGSLRRRPRLLARDAA